MATPRFSLQLLTSGQGGADITANEMVTLLECLSNCTFESMFFNQNTPPVSPLDGHTSWIGATPTGTWAGQASKISVFLSGSFRFFSPIDMLAFNKTSPSEIIAYSTEGAEWYPLYPRWTATEYWTGEWRRPIGDLGGTAKKVYAQVVNFTNIVAPLTSTAYSGGITIDFTYPITSHDESYIQTDAASGAAYGSGISGALGFSYLHKSLGFASMTLEPGNFFGGNGLDADILIKYCKTGP